MAKRYHQTFKDRYHEHAGEERAMHGRTREASRRTQEMQEAGMIHDDVNAIANLPQEVMIKPYAKNGSYLPENLDDTIRGVDRQIDLDDRKRDEHFMPKKV